MKWAFAALAAAAAGAAAWVGAPKAVVELESWSWRRKLNRLDQLERQYQDRVDTEFKRMVGAYDHPVNTGGDWPAIENG